MPDASKSPRIGIVCEGASDFAVLHRILAGYFQDPNLDPSPLQPPRDATTGAFEAGGWHQILEHCASEQFRGAFSQNDYIVVQIDTDISQEHPAYNVSHRDANGRPYTCDELVGLVCEKLIEHIGAEFYAAHQERIIFAVCVHSIECWLLPLYWYDSRRQKTDNCLSSLNEQLAKQENFTIHSKDARYYEKASKRYSKHRELRQHYAANPSLKIFVDALEARFGRGFTK